MDRIEDFPAPDRPISSTLRCFWRLPRSIVKTESGTGGCQRSLDTKLPVSKLSEVIFEVVIVCYTALAGLLVDARGISEEGAKCVKSTSSGLEIMLSLSLFQPISIVIGISTGTGTMQGDEHMSAMLDSETTSTKCICSRSSKALPSTNTGRSSRMNFYLEFGELGHDTLPSSTKRLFFELSSPFHPAMERLDRWSSGLHPREEIAQ